MTYELYEHQKRGVELVRKNKRFNFFWEPGVGKTGMMLSGLWETRAFPALIACPLSVIEHAWLDDAKNFVPDMRIESAHGPKRHRLNQLKRVAAGELDGIVINYEALRLTDQANQVSWGASVFDESTKLKSPSAKISKLAHRVSYPGSSRRSYILSGLPAPNNYLDLWSQCQASIPGVLPPSFYSFRNYYFYQPNPYQAKWLWKLKPDSEQQLLERLSPYTDWLKTESCVDLPEVTTLVREVSLGSHERAMYDKFIRSLVLEVEEGDVVGGTVLTELMKARQMTAGWVKLTRAHGGDEWLKLGGTKSDEVSQVVREMGRKPVIVVGQFRPEIEAYHARLAKDGRLPEKLYGGIGSVSRKEVIDRFNKGLSDTLIVQPQSMAHGLTLNCADMIFASISFNHEEEYQCKRRLSPLRGSGDKSRPCTYTYLLAKDTIDEDIYAALRAKSQFGTNLATRFVNAQRKRIAVQSH